MPKNIARKEYETDPRTTSYKYSHNCFLKTKRQHHLSFWSPYPLIQTPMETISISGNQLHKLKEISKITKSDFKIKK